MASRSFEYVIRRYRNEFCITCGVRHVPLAIYWHAYRVADHRVQGTKNYCGYCGAKMVTVRASQ
jgi:ribosomal protein S27AE